MAKSYIYLEPTIINVCYCSRLLVVGDLIQQPPQQAVQAAGSPPNTGGLQAALGADAGKTYEFDAYSG